MSGPVTAATRRLLVEVRLGASAGRRAVVAPGETLVCGRDEGCGLVLSGDPKVSARHFSVTWSDGACTVRDLKSQSGTSFEGERIATATLSNGDYLQAGGTIVMVYQERATPPPLGATELPAEQTASIVAELSAAPQSFHAKRAKLFAVLDPTRSPRVLELLRESTDEMASLYSGQPGLALLDSAPHLVCFRPDSDLLERVVAEGWTRRWGIFLVSRRPFKDVRTHLRRFLMVTDDVTDERLYFRFYDPRVLSVFHGAMSHHQAGQLFDDIAAYGVEGEGGRLQWLTRDERPKRPPSGRPASAAIEGGSGGA